MLANHFTLPVPDSNARRKTQVNDRFLLLQNRHICHPWQKPGPNGWKGYSPKVGALGDIDIESCEYCGGHVKVMPNAFASLTGQALACIEDQPVIDKILSHLEKKDALPSAPDTLPEPRAPPHVSLFYWQHLYVSWFEVLLPIGGQGAVMCL